jgi:hypothetical protein
MIGSEMKNIIAENCEAYEPKYKIVTMSVGRLSESCGNCTNFKREKCSKGLFDGAKDIIRIN